jgi:hypothetical protein
MQQDNRAAEPCSTLPTNYAPSLPKNVQPQAAIDRARLLVGCYRKEDWNDPDIAFRAIVSVFARYPESVVIAVTEPATGLPSRLKWPPSIAEVVEACKAEMAPMLREFDRRMVTHRQARLLAPPPPSRKMSIEEIEAKLGRPLSGFAKLMPERRFKSIDAAAAESARLREAEASRSRK